MNFDNTINQYNNRRFVIQSNKGMVATSQPLAAEAGIYMLKKGGNCIDAAVAAAACLTVVEPMSNGIGGDAFAIFNIGNEIKGLNGSGYSPELMTLEELERRGFKQMPESGLLPVTVPGIPAAWSALSKKYGKLRFEEILEPAIDYARYGYPVSPVASHNWKVNYLRILKLRGEEFEPWHRVFTVNGHVPKCGELWKSEYHAATLELIAESNADEFYYGELADKIDRFSKKFDGFIRKSDLEKYKIEWVKPVCTDYRGYDVWEIPPNGQGIITLMALNILKNFVMKNKECADTYHKQMEAIKLAFEDGRRYISDINHMDVSVESLLSETYGRERAGLIGDEALLPIPGQPDKGGTVYIAAADSDGNMISYIQSNYMGFGSGIVIPETGIALQNRGHNFCFNRNHPNCAGPNKKSYHTIIPGFLSRNGIPMGAFGVMGGFMQPQGHLQVLSNMIDFDLNPQDALNAPRWQWTGEKKFEMEPGIPLHIIEQLKNKGHDIKIEPDYNRYGRGQVIIRDENGVYTGGTEPRTDGTVAVC